MKLKFITVGQCRSEIQRLTRELNLPDEDPIWNLSSANRRIAALEGMKAKAAPAPKPAAAPVAVPVTIKSEPPKTTGPTRAQHMAILQAVEPMGARAVRDDWSDREVAAECHRVLFQNHLSIPGQPSDTELSAEYWRPAPPTGSRRYTRAVAKEQIAQILTTKKA